MKCHRFTMRQRSDFKLVGLSKGKRATLELLYTDRETFWAKIDMDDDEFDSLWEFCSEDWKAKKIAVIEHDGLYPDLTPINPIMVDYREWDIKEKHNE